MRWSGSREPRPSPPARCGRGGCCGRVRGPPRRSPPLSEIAAALLTAALIVAGTWRGLAVPVLGAFLVLLYRMQRPVRDLLAARIAFDTHWSAAADVADYLDRTDAPYLVSGSTRF